MSFHKLSFALSFSALCVACGGGAAQRSPSEPSASSGTYNLLFRDDFDGALDAQRWQIMTHSWDSNLALFSSQSVSVQDGALVLSLLPAPEGTVDSTGAAKPFFGAEVRSRDTLTYGRVRARIQFASGSAVVSSLVTLYTPWPADNWNELDTEVLGKPPTEMQYNTQVYTGPPTVPPVTQAVAPTQAPAIKALPFDPAADYHVYTTEWDPSSARFYVDDELIYTWTDRIALMTLPQNVLLTIWASNAAGWAGPVTADTTTAQIRYDWVELYDFVASK